MLVTTCNPLVSCIRQRPLPFSLFVVTCQLHVCCELTIARLTRSQKKMMFNAELAVNGKQVPAQALVDTDASHCYISEQNLASW